MSDLTPRLADIRFSFEMLSSCEVQALSNTEFRALMSLVRFAAAGLVWTYSPPGDGSFEDDDTRLARVAGLSVSSWRKIKPTLRTFFRVAKGRWHLDRAWVDIELGVSRPAIPADIRAKVAAREGRRCTYCGAREGPFAIDHIYPVALGGSSEPSNLTLACVTCNSSKGARTVREWMALRG